MSIRLRASEISEIFGVRGQIFLKRCRKCCYIKFIVGNSREIVYNKMYVYFGDF